MTHKTTELMPIAQRFAFRARLDLIFNGVMNQCHLGYWGLRVVDDRACLWKHRVKPETCSCKESRLQEMTSRY